jgi:8-oxo-dGTP pyrophosphatase MutT (NUDIX family)
LPLGGHIELDEDPEQALFREIKEESGLEIDILSQKPAQQFAGRKFLYPPVYDAPNFWRKKCPPCKPRHEFIDAGAEFTRLYPIGISSTSHHAA